MRYFTLAFFDIVELAAEHLSDDAVAELIVEIEDLLASQEEMGHDVEAMALHAVAILQARLGIVPVG